METVTLLFENVEVLIVIVTGIITLASLITAGTKTPDPDTKLGKAYKVVEWLSLTIGRAKENGKEGKQ